VIESIDPKPDSFDVAIIDEASQSGPEAIILGYLAKQLIVVGDDKQISPSFIGIDREEIGFLIRKYIQDFPFADLLGLDNSFFDFAQVKYKGNVKLREHFRCMPEIIQFSNNNFYSYNPIIPLRQYGADRLMPTVGTKFVNGGFTEGSSEKRNPPEARAIVDMIKNICADPKLEGKSIGVISLLGNEQAKYIEKLLLIEIEPAEIEKRHITCGDAYAFQGDERDIIFLSLVIAPGDGKRALTDARAEKRFNVAASRARDQMILFHSISPNEVPNPECFRHKLLEYCLRPKIDQKWIEGKIGNVSVSVLRNKALRAERDVEAPPDPFDSWFEIDVCLKIIDRGFRVIPQFEIGGYRIDLVVIGMKGRLAVECDGDRWHGSERYQSDLLRQRMLERCDWNFWRIRGSTFYMNPDKSLESLWETLKANGIFPAMHEESDEGRQTPNGGYKGATVELTPTNIPSPVAQFDKYDDFFSVVQLGIIVEVKQYISLGADVNAKDQCGRTPLHWAAWNSHKDTAQLLIDNGAEVDAKDNDGWTPLHRTALDGHTDMAKLLIENGADVNAEENEGYTPLHRAAFNGHTGTVQLLIENGADINAEESDGGTPLHWAAENGHTDMAHLLIENGADVNAEENDGYTPLHRASLNGHMDTAHLLIDSGADVNAEESDGGTPLHWAAENGHTDTAQLLIENGAEVNAEESEGYTPLHRAALNGHKDMAHLLIENGADVNAEESDGWTPLHWAAENGHTDTAQLLIENEAAVDAKEEDGCTPLHRAALNGHTDTAQLLIENGAEVNAEENEGYTPLHRAALNGHKDMAHLLIENGADVNAEESDGWTPLHWAAENGHTDTAQLLIENEAAVDAKDEDGCTPLHRAALNGHTDTAQLLIENGAEVNAEENEGYTPLHWATENGHTNTAKLLTFFRH
jgi:very-short-patch-repair endonuclease